MVPMTSVSSFGEAGQLLAAGLLQHLDAPEPESASHHRRPT
jgi:hypothetical protein